MRPAKTVKEVLKAMLWMYQNGLEWTQGTYWRDKHGHRLTHPNEGAIHSACLLGCQMMVEAENVTSLSIVESLRESSGYPGYLHYWNDASDRTKKDIISALKKAIRKCR